MSFSDGKSLKKAFSDYKKGTVGSSGLVPGQGGLHKADVVASQYIVDSINKAGTVTRLVYTSSIATMMGGPASGQRWNEHIVDETHLVEQGYRAGDHEYPATKLLIEKFFNDSA